MFYCSIEGSVEIIAKSEEIACKLLAPKDLKVENVTLLFERKDIRNAQQIKIKEVLLLFLKDLLIKRKLIKK